MTFAEFILSNARLACYENDPDPNDGEGNDSGEGKESEGGDEGNDGENKVFDQEAVNKMLAADRRKHRAQLEKVESQYKALLTNTKLTQEEKDELQNNLTEVQKQLRTREELAKQEKAKLLQQHSEALQTERAAREAAERKYQEAVITRELLDAAQAHEAYRSNQIVDLLRGKTRLVEDKPVVDFNDVSADTGEPIVIQISPAEAVKRMTEMTEWQNLFKPNLVAGLGSSSASGGAGQGNGRVDFGKMSAAEYIKYHREQKKRGAR